MTELSDLSPEELEAILGTDYETVMADALRRKESSEGSGAPDRAAGQMANGHVYFDPGYAIEKGMNRYRMGKEGKAAQGDLDAALADQKKGRMTYANALTRRPPTAPTLPMTAPMGGVSGAPAGASSAPPAPPAPPAMAPQVAAPPPLANASTMDPAALESAGVPPEVLAELLRKRRGY